MSKINSVFLFFVPLLFVGLQPTTSHALSENALISCVRGDIDRIGKKMYGPEVKRLSVAYASFVTSYFNAKSKQNEAVRSRIAALEDCEDFSKFIDQQTESEIKRLQEISFEDRASLGEKRLQRWSDYMSPSERVKATAFVRSRLKAAGLEAAAETLKEDQDFLRTFVLRSEREKFDLASKFTSEDKSKKLGEIDAESMDDGVFYMRRDQLREDLKAALDTCGCNWKLDTFAPVVQTGMKKSEVLACVAKSNDLAALKSYRNGKELFEKAGGLVSNVMTTYLQGNILCGSLCSVSRIHDWSKRIQSLIAESKDCASLKKAIKTEQEEYVHHLEIASPATDPTSLVIAELMAPESSPRYSSMKAFMFRKLSNAGMSNMAITFTYEHALLRQLMADYRYTPYSAMYAGGMSKAAYDVSGFKLFLMRKGVPEEELETASADMIEGFLLQEERKKYVEGLSELRVELSKK